MKSRNKKKFNWCDTTIDLLIDVWEEFLDDLRRAKRNSHVYKAMQAKMEEYDIKCDANEIANKIKNLKQKYRSEKKNIGPSGGTPSTWKWYTKINSFLGRLPINNESLIQESTDSYNDTDSIYEDVEYLNLTSTCDRDDEILPSTSSSAKKQKLKMVNIQQDILIEIQKSNKIEEERSKREEQYLQLSSQYLKDSFEQQEQANNISERSLLLAEENLKLQKLLFSGLTK